MRTITSLSLTALSHDLRTPLVGILGLTSFLIKEHLTPKQKEYATIILNEARCLLDVVNSITSSARNENFPVSSPKFSHNFNHSTNGAVKSRVLLVEDSPIVRQVHSRMLKEIDCQFDLAVNAEQALAMVFDANGKANYGVILMDIELGEGMNGLEASAQIRQRENGKEIRIIALSATAEEKIREDGLAAQIDRFVSKPIGVEKLKEIIYGEMAS